MIRKHNMCRSSFAMYSYRLSFSSFFFHYSGHGGRVRDEHGDEDDGYDETIYPVDFDSYEGTSGQIVDDLMHDIMVRPLCKGSRLTCIFDSCHSGTALDLPYVRHKKSTKHKTNETF